LLFSMDRSRVGLRQGFCGSNLPERFIDSGIKAGIYRPGFCFLVRREVRRYLI
jgi:hypothetical protein